MMVNVSFDVQGDHAHGACNLIYFHFKGGKTELTRWAATGTSCARSTATGSSSIARFTSTSKV